MSGKEIRVVGRMLMCIQCQRCSVLCEGYSLGISIFADEKMDGNGDIRKANGRNTRACERQMAAYGEFCQGKPGSPLSCGPGACSE